MRYTRYCVVAFVLAAVSFAAPVWPLKIETRGHTYAKVNDGPLHIVSGYHYWSIWRVPFAYSKYGWIKENRPPYQSGPWDWLAGQSGGNKPPHIP